MKIFVGTANSDLVNFSDSGMSVTFSVQGDRKVGKSTFPGLAAGELSITDKSIFEDLLEFDEDHKLDAHKDKINDDRYTWYFFNRLIMPENFKPSNASVLIMKAIAEWADKNNIIIIDGLNPYGRMNMQQLIQFNKLFGFVLIMENTMVRFPKH